ncbi:MAG: matrixin family metalloprotease, partial [Patescibacteria group bacterium]|nr:matrixin family metalloprotease [Patescibacteria group bacterium]
FVKNIIMLSVALIIATSNLGTVAYGQQSIRVYFEPLPDYVSGLDKVTDSSFQFWDQNANVNFYQSFDEKNTDIIVKWVKEDANFQNEEGYYYGSGNGQGIISVALGDSYCNGEWRQYTSQTIVHILEHELGHSLGYQHSTDKGSIMYPTTYTQYVDGCQVGQNYGLLSNQNSIFTAMVVLAIVGGLAVMVVVSKRQNQ